MSSGKFDAALKLSPSVGSSEGGCRCFPFESPARLAKRVSSGLLKNLGAYCLALRGAA